MSALEVAFPPLYHAANKGHQPRQEQHLLRLNGYAAEVLIAPGFYFTNGENS
jgi:hypothetical protein